MTAAASARMRPLDPKFAKVVALMRSTQHEGEKANARATAERLAADAGMTLDEAMDTTKPAAPFVNIFSGFDDYMEEREPGWKAKCARERAAKVEAWKARRAALVVRYGSLEAAMEPCAREKLIRAACRGSVTALFR